MLKTTKHHIIFFLFSIFFALFIGGIIAYCIDPYHLFHETPWNRNRWLKERAFVVNRGQIKELLYRKNQYDGILVGNSLIDNFHLLDFDKNFEGKKWIKLEVLAATLDVQALLIQESLKSQKVKNVVLILSTAWFYASKTKDFSGRWFMYYRPLMMKNALYFMFDSFVQCRERPFEKAYHHAKMQFIADFPTQIYADYRQYELKEDEHCIFKFNSLLLPLIQDNAKVQFRLILYPMVFESRCSILETFNQYFPLLRYLCSLNLPNVQLYAFHDMSFVKHHKNTFDGLHYHEGINKFIVYCMKHKLHKITMENYEHYQKQVIKNIHSFSPEDLKMDRDSYDQLVAEEEKLHPELKGKGLL